MSDLGMPFTDKDVELFERMYGIKMTEGQKTRLKSGINVDMSKSVMPRHIGETQALRDIAEFRRLRGD